ncbi:probable serine/threonine-protein kinase WNK11 [Chenopodium quinoa]|uniref:probable serine/threonine-protein kinase WNK11 n=1 Tax=Chenopodium quinoa TaxID=63459 RepID=UPI000B77859B|nr:probable serine/threonine-protein kinase WNK11 [Chenopodium quinoa]
MASSSNDLVVETDPSGQYKRYDTIIRMGNKRTVYKGLDGANLKEIAWSKVEVTGEMRDDKNLLQRLCAEPQLLNSLRHDNVVSCFNVWIGDEKINMIAESFPLGNIGEYVRKHDVTDINAIKNWCTQILKGLDHLHRHDPKIIHRDIDCDKIFFDGSFDRVKIGELGFGWIFEEGNETPTFCSKPQFMAPEVLKENHHNELVDIHSFGMCVLQMVTRETPYSECRSNQHILGRVGRRIMPDALSKVTDSEVKRFIEKCLRPASDRPTANELLNDSFLQPSVSSSVAASSSLSMNEPRPFRIKGKSLETGPFKMTLFIAGEEPIKFDFPVNDTTQEVMEKEGLSARMSDAELSLVSELLGKLKTELSSSDGSEMKLLQITSEEREVRISFQETDEQ